MLRIQIKTYIIRDPKIPLLLVLRLLVQHGIIHHMKLFVYKFVTEHYIKRQGLVVKWLRYNAFTITPRVRSPSGSYSCFINKESIVLYTIIVYKKKKAIA